MRNIIKFSVVAVIAMAFWMGTKCAAQSYPSGSYQQTCRNINTRGNTLEADCDNGNGQWNRTSLRNYQGCGEIANINGTLQCNGSQNNGAYNNGGYNRDNNGGYNRDNNGGYNRDNNGGYNRDRDGDNRNGRNGSYQNGWQNGVPPGSYAQSCQNIRISGNTLRASCRKNNGQNREASLSNFNQCSDIANNNGKLRCNR